MKRGNKKVDQITKEGFVRKDFDTSLSPNEITIVLQQYFAGLQKAESSPSFYIGTYKGHKYAIRCKNVTYLGNPHPAYKKRIQIADDLFEFYKKAKNLDRTPILLGVYTYEDHTIFVNFSIDTYIGKTAHNSSAHIYSSDLAMAAEDGYFEKVDYFGNTVTAFRPDMVQVFMDELFGRGQESFEGMKAYDLKSAPAARDCGDLKKSAMAFVRQESDRFDAKAMSACDLPREEMLHKVIFPQIKEFFLQVPKHWNGIDCYKEMIANGYKNKFQPEWVGFFLEYAFEKFLTEHDLLDVIRYYQDKSDGGVDLDLFFPQIHSFGDLKAHSEESRGIQGNDWETVFSIINGQKPEDHIYYIVCEHSTEKDDKYDYEVTKFWNRSQNKDNLMSYHKRMKNNVTLKKVYVLDINYKNREHLTMFKQGINSNGKPRAPKIMIEQDNLKYFILDEIKL